MTLAILQTFLAVAACYGLWRFWRALDGRGTASLIITAGFVVRALGAQVLFWISWLRLPVARSLQLGDGFWFFAVDGTWYLRYARELLVRGPKAIVFIDETYASRIFTQWFTVFAGAFGAVASTGILFNCLLYLATCALILKVSRADETSAPLFTLAAIAFGPASILWSLQLLKDTFFVFLIVAMVALWSEWQRLWRGAARRTLSIAVCGVAMWYAVYAIAGVRWYAGAMVAVVSLLFLGLVANLPRPRVAASAVAVLLFLTLGQAFLAGGSLDVPLPVRAALDVKTLFQAHVQAERAKLVLTTARRGFETTPGNTMIAPGKALLQSAVPLPAPIPKKAAPISEVEPVETATPPAPKIAAAVLTPAIVTSTIAPPKPVDPPPPPSLVSKVAAGAAAMFLPRVIAQAIGLVRIGGGRGFWLFADVDTLVFDFVVLFAFAFCLRAIVRRERRVTPLFVLVLLVFVGLTGPMSYAVTNFGTLFRLREMVYVLAAILPLTLDRRTPEPAPGESR